MPNSGYGYVEVATWQNEKYIKCFDLSYNLTIYVNFYSGGSWKGWKVYDTHLKYLQNEFDISRGFIVLRSQANNGTAIQLATTVDGIQLQRKTTPNEDWETIWNLTKQTVQSNMVTGPKQSSLPQDE